MKKKIVFIILSISAFALILAIAMAWVYRVNTPYHDSRQLIKYIEAGNYSKVQDILEEGANPNVPETGIPHWVSVFFEDTPRIPLKAACEKNDVEMVKLLIKYGARGDAIDGTGCPPLCELLKDYDSTDLELVKLLLENGADSLLRYGDFYDWPVFQAARMYPGDRNIPFKDRVYDENIAKEITEIVLLLLPEDFDMQGPEGAQLLSCAGIGRNIYLIKYLMNEMENA